MSTIDYYDQNAQEYYERTVDADLAEIREYFLGFLRRDARILDFGCGSGRDAKAFAEAGRTVEALDGSQELCRIASEYLGMDRLEKWLKGKLKRTAPAGANQVKEG